MFESTYSIYKRILKNRNYCKKRASDLVKLTGHTSILPREVSTLAHNYDPDTSFNIISDIQPSIIIYNQVFDEVSSNSIEENEIQQLFLNIKKKGIIFGSTVLDILKNFPEDDDNKLYINIILCDLVNNQDNELCRSINFGPLANYDLVMRSVLIKNTPNVTVIKNTPITNMLDINYYEPEITYSRYFYFTLKKTRSLNKFNFGMDWNKR